MDFIQRKVFLTKNLRPYDTNGDGVFNALVLSATTKMIQVPIRHSFDDMGIFEVSDEESFEIIDIGGFFDGSNTDVTQPLPPIDGVTIDWGTGPTTDTGNGGTNETDITYCGDLTAINGATISYDSNGATLTSSSTSITYPNPTPTFTVNNSLCLYTDPDTTGDGNASIPDGPSDIQCIMSCTCDWAGTNPDNDCLPNSLCNCQWTTDSWSSYYSTALSNANAHCQAIGYTSTLVDSDFLPGMIQGDPSTTNTNPFAEVKLKQSWSGWCCYSRNSNGDCTGVATRYRYEYCFHCKT